MKKVSFFLVVFFLYSIWIYIQGRVYKSYLVWDSEVETYVIYNEVYYSFPFDKFFYSFFDWLGISLKTTVVNTHEVIGYDPLNYEN